VKPPEVKPPETAVKPPQTEVKAPATDLKSPETGVKPPEVKPPETAVKPPQTEVKAPATDLKSPETGVKPPEVKPPETAVKPPVAEETTPTKPPVVEKPTPAKPPVSEETAPAKPSVSEETTPAKPPVVEEPTPAKPRVVEETAPTKPPGVEETAPVKPPVSEETTSAKPPMAEESTPTKPPVAEETPLTKPPEPEKNPTPSEVTTTTPDAGVKVPDGLGEQAPGGARYVDLEHVEKKTIRMYEEIAAMTDDVARIAKNTGIPEHYIAKVKEHLFLKEHELEVANYMTREIRREKGNFSPLPDIAEGWMNAINKSMQVEELAGELADFRQLIAHEYIEAGLMDDGLPYMNPNSWREHPRYGWGNYPVPGDKGYGAHNLAPNPNATQSAFGHWETDLGKSPEGLSLAKDLSNLDEVLKKIRKIIEEKE
jgi:hypothetical protein